MSANVRFELRGAPDDVSEAFDYLTDEWSVSKLRSDEHPKINGHKVLTGVLHLDKPSQRTFRDEEN